MNSFFKIRLGSDGAASQSEISDLLKTNGCEVIQLSDGLCVKSAKPLSELQKLIEKKASGLMIEELDSEEILADAKAPADLKAFVH